MGDPLQHVIDYISAKAPADNSIEALRRWVDSLGRDFPMDSEVEPLPARDAPVQLTELRPPGAKAGAGLLYLHGGAYVAGSLASHGGFLSKLALAAGMSVWFLDYRLAPEHPCPAALEDALAAWLWLTSTGALRPDRAAIGGDSAGGGLALATLQALCANGAALPSAALLISPWTDMTFSGASVSGRADLDPMVSMDALVGGRAAYGGELAPDDPRLSPLFAALDGLPPMLIQVGEREIIHDDSTRLAERARLAGSSAELRIWPGMPHVWHLFAHLLPKGRAAILEAADFLATHTK